MLINLKKNLQVKLHDCKSNVSLLTVVKSSFIITEFSDETKFQ